MPARLLERLKIGPGDTFIAHRHDHCLQANFPVLTSFGRCCKQDKYEAPMDILLIAQFSFFPCSIKFLFRQLFDIILMSDEDLKALLLFFEYFASYRY